MTNPFQPGAVPLVLALALVPSPEAAEPTTPGTRMRKIGRGAASSVFSRTEFDDMEGSESRDPSDK